MNLMGSGKGKARRGQTTVNPALFRLRAFEIDWVAPLLDEPDSELRSFLLAEAKQWGELGQQIGYFETAPFSDERLATVPADKLAAVLADQEQPEITLADFQDSLMEAQEDLTPERREFLNLVFFSDEKEWNERLGQASALADQLLDIPVSELTSSPKSIFSAEAMDNVSWLLGGPDSELEDGAGPA